MKFLLHNDKEEKEKPAHPDFIETDPLTLSAWNLVF